MSATLARTLAPLPATKRGANVLMGGDPKGKNILYTNGSSVIIRNLSDPSDSDMYSEHTCEATVARFSPSGFYICSGDVQGNLRIWDTTNTEHILKYEYRPLSGAVKDLAWSEDSKRIVVGGDGRDKFGAAIMWDTGATVGEISGHSKCINSIDFKPNRPYRVATAGEDNESAFFHGPPFKYQFSNKDHTRFVQIVRFAPNGETYVTASSDGKIFVYDGKSGEKKGELGSPAHRGSVMCVAWSPDNSKLLSVSADKTAKLWDVAANACETEFTFGDDVEEQQLGCVWVGDCMVTLSLSGHLNYLDPANPARPRRVVMGHNKPITALAISEGGAKVISGDYSGRMVVWDVAKGLGEEFHGNGHTNQINAIVVAGGSIITAGMDDAVMVTSAAGTEWGGSKTPTESCPVGAAVGGDGDVTAVACVSGIELHRGGSKVAFVKADWDPLSVAMSHDGAHVAVGGKDGKLHLYEVGEDSLKEVGAVDCKGQVHTCAFSPDSSMVATGDSGRNVLVFSVPSLELKVSGWVFHSARINSLAWSPNGQYIASAGLDTNIFIWSLENRTKRINIKKAHMGSVTQVAWLSDTKIVSGGQDSALRIWDVQHH